MKRLLLIILLFFISCNSSEEKLVDLKLVWESNEGLISPESIVVDSTRNCLYVSNSQEYAFSGTGYISKHELNGTLIDSTWITGLNRPTGMAVSNSRLFVADMDQVLEIDIPTRNILKRYKVEGEFTGLNDVTIDEENNVYISASNIHGIYRLQHDSLALIHQDTTRLQWANGVVLEGDKMIVAGLRLSKIELNSGVASPIEVYPKIEDFDGLQLLDNSGYVLSSAGGVSKLWYIHKYGKVTELLDADSYFGDFQIVDDHLYVPRGNHKTGKYQIQCYKITYK